MNYLLHVEPEQFRWRLIAAGLCFMELILIVPVDLNLLLEAVQYEFWDNIGTAYLQECMN